MASGILPNVLIVMNRFSASVVMAVTYGYDMNDGETFVTSMQRATDIVLRFGTPELSAMCATFPFSGCLLPDLMLRSRVLTWIGSQGITDVVSGNEVQV